MTGGLHFSKGVESLRLGAASEAVTAAGLVGLLMGGELVLRESNAHVPHEEGDLERTGKVTEDVEGRKVDVSYDDVAYPGQAVDQHENMTYKHDEGRTAKFLENSMNSNADAVLNLVGEQIRRRLGQ